MRGSWGSRIRVFVRNEGVGRRKRIVSSLLLEGFIHSLVPIERASALPEEEGSGQCRVHDYDWGILSLEGIVEKVWMQSKTVAIRLFVLILDLSESQSIRRRDLRY